MNFNEEIVDNLTVGTVKKSFTFFILPSFDGNNEGLVLGTCCVVYGCFWVVTPLSTKKIPQILHNLFLYKASIFYNPTLQLFSC